MSPQTILVAQQLRQLIYYHLDNDLAQNALFFAARLHASDPQSSDAAHLLALCHLKLGQLKAAYDYSRDKALRTPHLGCVYVFAQACLGLERFTDGIAALERSRGLWAARNHWNKHSHFQRQHLPDAAAVSCLLGKLHRANGNPSKASEYFVESLKLNPFMWDAFDDLCDAGVVLHTPNIFKMNSEMIGHLSLSDASISQPDTNQSQGRSHGVPQLTTPGNDPFNSTSRTAGDPGLNYGGSNLLSRLNGSFKNRGKSRTTPHLETPTANGSQQDEDTMMGDLNSAYDSEAPHAPLRKTRHLQEFNGESTARPMTTRSRTKASSDDMEGPRSSIPVTHKRTISGQAPPGMSSVQAEAPARRSNRILNSISATSTRLAVSSKDVDGRMQREVRKAKAPSVRTARATTSTVGRVVSGNRKPLEPAEREAKEIARSAGVASTLNVKEPSRRPAPAVAQTSQEYEALQWLLDLMGKLGEGHYLLSRYACQQALQTFSSVAPSQRETPWVLSQIGRAHYERASYTEAEKAFIKVKKICPSRMEDMEIYSTVLWHLKNELELAYLAHELVEADRLSPQAWCAIGNSFSLQREHEQAVKCFKRATQLDPKFAYAFTLQGHEYVASEELEKAQFAYRSAIAADHRHYNGWYGLGQCAERLGKFDMAEKHYKVAQQINPTNPVLPVCIGRVFEKMHKPMQALSFYALAAPNDKNARFMKARALMRLKRLDEAYQELETLKDLAPDEATVHYMLGKLHRVRGDKANAIRHFTIALNLDPKAAPHIKEALESLEQSSDLEDEDEY